MWHGIRDPSSNRLGQGVALAAGVVAMTLCAPAAASAANFFAAPSDQGTGDCLSAGNECTLPDALDLVNDNSDADTVTLTAGTFADGLPLTGANFSGIEVIGAGRDQTILAPDSGGAPFSFGLNSLGGVTVRDMTLSAANSQATAISTVSSNGGSTTLEDVRVISRGTTEDHNALTFSAKVDSDTHATLRRVIIEHFPNVADDNGDAIAFSSGGPGKGSLTVEDSQIDMLTAWGGDLLTQGGSAIIAFGNFDANIQRNTIRMRRAGGSTPTGGGIVLSPSGSTQIDLVVTDNAVTGGAEGIGVRATASGVSAMEAYVYRNSVDAGTVGVSDAANGLLGVVDGDDFFNVFARDNVIVDDTNFFHNVPTDPQRMFVTCANNALFGAIITGGLFNCTDTSTGTGGGSFPNLNPGVAWNTGQSVSATSAAAWTAAPGASLLDRGAGVVDNGEGPTGATDLAGNPRSVDADDPGCEAAPDPGAYERQGLACQPTDPGDPGDPTNVVISDLALSPKSPRSRKAGRAVLGYKLSAPATVTATLERKKRGNLVKVGRTATQDGAAGANKLKLRKLSGRKRMKPGRYVASLAVAGGPTSTLAFKVRR